MRIWRVARDKGVHRVALPEEPAVSEVSGRGRVRRRTRVRRGVGRVRRRSMKVPFRKTLPLQR